MSMRTRAEKRVAESMGISVRAVQMAEAKSEAMVRRVSAVMYAMIVAGA